MLIPPFAFLVAETLTRRLVKKVNQPRVWLETYLVARFELMAFTKHRDDVAVAHFGYDLEFGTGRLDHLNQGVDAIVGQEKMLRPHAANSWMPVTTSQHRAE